MTRKQEGTEKQSCLKERTLKPTRNKQVTRTEDPLPIFRFGSTPSNNMQDSNTEATLPLFRFGTAKLKVQYKAITTIEKTMHSQDQEASKEEEVTTRYPLNKKVKRRKKKVIRQYDLKQRELEEAQSRKIGSGKRRRLPSWNQPR